MALSQINIVEIFTPLGGFPQWKVLEGVEVGGASCMRVSSTIGTFPSLSLTASGRMSVL